MDAHDVLEHLLRNAQWTANRSSGPGGQHRDKASTRAELSLGLESLVGLEPNTATRLADFLGLADRPLRITAQEDRSLSRNQEIAVGRLSDLVAEALAPPPPARKRTRPSRARREARLTDKKSRGTVKRLRRPPAPDA
jgi:ribosome-associated protein